MTDLFTHCEHILLWGTTQPLNILSSVIFWFTAWWLYHQHRPKAWSYPFWLIAGVEFIGWASLFWHFTHITLGITLDIGSTVLWLAAYGVYVLHKNYRWPYLRATLSAVAFLVLSWGLGRVLNPWLLQTSGAFIPLTILLLLAGWHTRNRWWTYSGISLAIATALRTFDVPLCNLFPLGTHWLWHIGSAFSLYTAMRAILGKPKKAN